MVRWLLSKSMNFVLYRPRLASACVRVLSHFPGINERLISIASDDGLITSSHGPVPKPENVRTRKQTSYELAGVIDTDREPDGSAGGDISTIRIDRPGRNQLEKSPLEKWFY